MCKVLSSYELLEALSSAFGPSGCEDAVANLICEQIEAMGLVPTCDKVGNVFVRLGT